MKPQPTQSSSSRRASPYPVHPPAQVPRTQKTPNTPTPSSTLSSPDSIKSPSAMTPGRDPTPPTISTTTAWDPAPVPLDLRCASKLARQTNQPPMNSTSTTSNNGTHLVFGAPKMEGEGILSSDDNKITLHYIQSQLPDPRPPLPPPPQQMRPCTPVPSSSSTFPGLGTTVIEGSFSVLITDMLEENYKKCRMALLREDGALTTPIKFLTILCNRMGVDLHLETVVFRSGNASETQYRTEIYVGGFCGVAHALSSGFSKQLAAAHCLERMRIHFRTIKQSSYALYPGSRYTKIGGKLDELCLVNKLGIVGEAVRDRQRYEGRRDWGGTQGGNSRAWGRDLGEVKWACSCIVKNFKETVLSDNLMFGTLKAKAKMYMTIVKSLEVPVVQIKDYFAVGVDCPMFKDIYTAAKHYKLSDKKRKWMKEYAIPHKEMDTVLHDPTNRSKYLNETFLEDKLARFGKALNDALEWLREETAGNLGNTGSGFRQCRDWEMDEPTTAVVVGRRDKVAKDVEMDGKMNEADFKEEDKFNDAMEI